MLAAPPKTKCQVIEYAKAVLSGKIVAGKPVSLACQRHLDDLRNGQERGLYWDQDAADRAITFPSLLLQSKGKWAGEPLVLEPWQAFIIGSIFGWKRANGTRRYRIAHIEVARKNGKSTLAATVALYLLDFDNEPGAEVYAAALKREQAKIVWGEAARMVRKTTSLRKRVTIIDSRANMHVLATESKFEALGKDNDSLDGLNVHGAIIDELHAHPNRYIVDILETAAAARRQPLFFYITTAGLSSKETIYQEMHQRARRVVENVVEDDRQFVYIATLDEGDDWKDPAVYIKSNPNLGVTVELDELVAERDKALDSPGREDAYRRLRLNQQTQRTARWLDMTRWDACGAAVVLDKLRGRPCYAGLDLAASRDLTALCLAFPWDDGFYDFLWRYWIPDGTAGENERRDRVPYSLWARQGYIAMTPGDQVDYGYILAKLKEDRGVYDIRELAFDRWGSQKLTTDLVEIGFRKDPKVPGPHLVEFGQGFGSMAAPTNELMSLVLAGKIRHGGNPVSRWCADNMVVATDPAGNLKPDKEKATQKIDGIVAMIMALDRATRHRSSGGKSVYESRGLTII